MSKIVLQPSTLITPEAGTIEYDGRVPYFTPQGTQRGVIPGMQYYRLNSALVGSNASGAQNVFGVGCQVSANTVYAFEHFYAYTKTAGTTSHSFNNQLGGTFTANNVIWYTHYTNVQMTGGLPNATGTTAMGVATGLTGVAGVGGIAVASMSLGVKGYGTISVNAGGTLIPQYVLSAAPGGAYTTAVGSYFLIYPIGTAGSNTSVGTWA